MKMNKKGFTLIEMLVVIAVIAILVSIVIPVVGDSTEKAKEARDAANIRSAIATVTTQALAGTYTEEENVDLLHKGSFSILAESGELRDIGGFDPTIFTGKISVGYCDDCHAVIITVDGVTYVAPKDEHDCG